MKWLLTIGRLVTILLLLLAVNRVIAQDSSYVDSLTQMTTSTNDSSRVIGYRSLAWYYMRYDLDLAEIYAKKVDEAGRLVNEPFYHTLSYYYLGIINRVRGDFLKALDYFEPVEIFYASDTIYQYSLINTYYQLGAVYQQMNMYDKSLEYLLKELAWAEKKKDFRRVSANYNVIGIVYKDMKQIDQALAYYDRAIAIARAHDFSTELAVSLLNKSQIHELHHEYDKSLKMAEEALVINSRENYEEGMSQAYEMMGRAKAKLNDRPQAIALVKKAYSLSEKLGLYELMASKARSIAEIYLEEEKWSEALPWAIKAEEISRELQDLQSMRDGQVLLSTILSKRGEYRRVAELEQSIRMLDDSLYASEKISLANQLEAKFQFEKKEGEINRLKLENELNTLRIEKEQGSKRRLWVGIGFVLFLSILAIRILQMRILSNKLRLEKQQIVNEQEVSKLRQANTVLALTGMVEGQEEERNRIAQDLHDGLGGLLSTIRSHYINLKNIGIMEQGMQIYRRTESLIDEACDEIRRISHDMMPPSLRVLGLANAIQDLGSRLHTDQMNCEVSISGEKAAIPDNKELMIYRVVQELCHNVVKHADASHLLIQLQYNPDELVVLVEDNGMGFDVEKVRSGMGLNNVRSRVEFLSGQIDVYSTMDKGTSIAINIPLNVLENSTG